MTRLYIAYGSNLCMDQMALRCPKAEPVGTTELTDSRLVFRSVADVERAKGFTVPVGVWFITPECEEALDRYEGVRPNGGLYRKVDVAFDDGQKALMYVMNDKGILPPSEYYLSVIERGYKDFGLDPAPLKAAVAHATAMRKPTRETWNRWQTRVERDPRHSKLALRGA